jgi:hypothetical protein
VLPGIVTSADIFNMWPHLYNSSTHKAWTIHTFQISGAALELMVQAFFRVGGGLKMSNTRVVMDYSATIQRLSSITIGNEPLQSLRKYKVAATEGIIEAFDFLDSHFGTKLGATQMQDTGIEAWRVIREKLKRIGTLGPGNASWQGRVRSLQPDLYLPYEELVSWPGFGTVGGRFEIVNIGMQAATVEGVRIKLYISADGGVTKPWVQLTQPQYNFTSLAAGKNAEVRFQQNLPDLRPGQHLYIAISVRKANGELHLENNRLETMLY